MRRILFIVGLLIAIPSWFIYSQIPSWTSQIMFGIRQPDELPLAGLFLSKLSSDPFNALAQLNDYSMIAGIIGIVLIAISLFLPQILRYR